MKKFSPISMALKSSGCLMVCLMLLFQPLKSDACVDYHNSIWVSCDYDAGFNEILVRVSNMHLFGSPQGVFCTCGISNYTNIFSNIQYVSFVDSGTTTPISGFVPWSANTTAASSWNTVQSGNWDAFLAETTASGLTTGDAVDLIIRASLPPGYTFSYMDSNLVVTSVGTDEYSTTTNSVTMGHNSISNFPFSGIIYTQQPLSYFSTIDNVITDVIELEKEDEEVQVYPNPFTNELSIDILLEDTRDVNVFISDLAGRKVKVFANQSWIEGVNQLKWTPKNVPNGIYLATIQTSNALRVKRLLWLKE